MTEAQVVQDGVPTLWTLGAAAGPEATRTFLGYPTGGLIIDSEDLTYVGSAHGVEGWMVFHIFERTPQ